MENNSQIPKATRIRLSTKELLDLYASCLAHTDLSSSLMEFMNFYRNWTRSFVYRVPSGFIRIESYPELRSATVHGVFSKNPYRDRENILNVLDCYMDDHPKFTHLECHVDKKFKGVLKFVASISHSSSYHSGEWIFYYGGRK